MDILVINASPNGENSVTLKLTRAFLEGMGQTAEIVSTAFADIAPCKACYACWNSGSKNCVIRDKGYEIIEKIKRAELVIWSIPLFCYGAPSQCKAVMDRMLSTNSPAVYIGDDGLAHHPGFEGGSKKALLISSAGLPDVEGNFDGLVFQLKRMFGQGTQAVLCAEGPLFMIPPARDMAEQYLKLVQKAGGEYMAKGHISPETLSALNTPMMPREQYIKLMNRE